MKPFSKILILFLFPLILVCCNNDDNPIDEFTPPTIFFNIDGSEVIMNNYYAVKNNNRLVIVMENDSNERLEIKLKDLPDGTQGYFLLSQVSAINFFDGSTNTAYSSKKGNSFFTGDSILIENYSISQKNISVSFNASVYGTQIDSIQIENVNFNLQFEESSLQDTYSASLNGNLLSSDSTGFGTAEGHIHVSQNNHDGFISCFFPLNVEVGEYSFSPIPFPVSNTFIPIGGVIFINGIDYSTLSVTANIIEHTPIERRFKGDLVIENSDNIITVDFDGFYF